MKRLYIILLFCIVAGIFVFSTVEYMRSVEKRHIEYRLSGIQADLNNFLHMYKAENLAVQCNTNFPRRAVICLSATLSCYTDIKNKYGLRIDKRFNQNLREAVDIVRKESLVSISIDHTESDVIVKTNAVQVDFSFLMEDN